MTSEQNRRAKGDWAAFEAGGRDLEARAETVHLEREDLALQVEPLQLAVEEGVTEYKKKLADEAFRALEDARFRSLTSVQILGIAKVFALYSYICTVQRQLADGTIVIRDHQSSSAESFEPEAETDVKKIISEIQERVVKEPELRMQQPVKNILMQLSRYSRELEKFKEVTARTPADKRAPIAANFKKSSEEIFTSIRKNYDQLEQEERDARPTQPQHILLKLPVKELSGLFLAQARQAMEARSLVLYAKEEQTGTREMLLEVAERHESFIRQITDESAAYLKLGQTEAIARRVSRSFAQELVKRIEREIEVY